MIPPSDLKSADSFNLSWRVAGHGKAMLRGCFLGFFLSMLSVPVLSVWLEPSVGHARSVKFINELMPLVVSLTVVLNAVIVLLWHHRKRR